MPIYLIQATIQATTQALEGHTGLFSEHAQDIIRILTFLLVAVTSIAWGFFIKKQSRQEKTIDRIDRNQGKIEILSIDIKKLKDDYGQLERQLISIDKDIRKEIQIFEIKYVERHTEIKDLALTIEKLRSAFIDEMGKLRVEINEKFVTKLECRYNIETRKGV
jgi:hypothetical protein